MQKSKWRNKPQMKKGLRNIFIAFLFFCPIFSFAQPLGANMANPIVTGTYGGGSFSYTDTKNNSPANGFGNDYGQSSDDIYYRFIIQATAQINISHCSSAFDTYVHLLNSDGSFIASNDDNGPLCSGLTASISITLAAGTYYIVSEGYSSSSGNITTVINLVVQTPPPTVFNTRNFIRTWEATAPEQDANLLIGKNLKEVKQATTYFDGLARPEQVVIKKGSLSASGNTDIVTPIEYDNFGREAKKYLPYIAGTADGIFKEDAFTAQLSFNQGFYSSQAESGFYAQTNYEASPLNRVEKTMAPGSSWVGSGRGVEAKYWSNTTTDNVKIWIVTNGTSGEDFGSYTTTTSYPAGELYKTVTVDEAGKQVIEFKDKEGKVILKKVQLTAIADDGTGRDYAGWLNTYYIYDDLNRLRCVVQPAGVEALPTASYQLSTTLLGEQCFRYEYDERGRMTMKKVPGAAEVYMVYDVRDRLVLTQDGNLRAQSKWMFTNYENDLNRPLATGLISDANNLAYHKDQAYNSIAYPNLANYSPEELTRTFYDNYTWRGSYGNPLTDTRSTAYDSYLSAPSNTSFPYPQAVAQSNAIRGMITGTRVKVLGSSPAQYLYTVNFYDEKGRVIQVQSQNITGGTDITTMQYSFSGQQLINIVKHEKAGANAQTNIVLTQMSYDDLGRVSKVEKKLSNTLVNNNAMPAAYNVILENEYDKLGQLLSKKIGRKKDINGNYTLEPVETLGYDYNIRGWLLGANRDYAKATNSNSNFFGFDLGYDKTGIASIGSFAQPAFNGNITGMVWKSTGDDEIRKYDFTYDAVNRLTGADFNQYTGGFNKDAGMDFSVSNLSYDANGNILFQNQKGWKVGGSNFIDQLNYSYQLNSNKLSQVTDASNDNTSKLGDFKYDAGTKTSTDYNYDINGNLISDQNKKISSIAYNYLNLPENISVTTKGTIEYVYDAGGNKLRKIVNETGQPQKTTLYMFGIYENDILQFLPHEEGRIRFKPAVGSIAASLQYDYMLKDHLGNVRMVLTEEQQENQYPAATMETAQTTTEEALYSNVNTTRNDLPSGYPGDSYTNPNDKVAKVKISPSGDGGVGPAIVLKVMAGDKFNLRVSSWYKLNGTTPGTPVNPLNDLLNALTNNIGAIAGSKATPAELQSNNTFNTPATNFLNSQNGYTTSKPKAFINWILFDEQFQYVSSSSGFEQVGSDEEFKVHVKTELPVNKNGYLYIYVSNETHNIDVFFDNLQVTHIRGAILEETHYYPFGLTMAGISSKSAGGVENKKKYNGIEFENDLEIQTYDAFFRELDPQTARWWQIDPVTEGYENLSPYASMYDNPITNSDPLGDEGEDCCWEQIKAVGNYIGGAVVGTVVGGIDNVTGSNLRGQISSSFAGTGAAGSGWNMGLNVADAGGMVLGAVETVTGAGGMLGAGLATVGTGGIASPVTIPVGVGSVALATHGVFTMGNSANNMINQNGRVDASSNSSGGSKPSKSTQNNQTTKPSKVEKSTKTEQVGDFTKKTKVEPSKKSPGQSRAEYVTYKNKDGKTVRTHKDSYDRGNKFQGRKPLRGGPEGRPVE